MDHFLLGVRKVHKVGAINDGVEWCWPSNRLVAYSIEWMDIKSIIPEDFKQNPMRNNQVQ
jgi:hypothetical protein